MKEQIHYISISYDQAAGVYFVHDTDIPGLNAEAESAEEMVRILPDLVFRLLVENEDTGGSRHMPDVPYSLMFDMLHARQATLS